MAEPAARLFRQIRGAGAEFRSSKRAQFRSHPSFDKSGRIGAIGEEIENCSGGLLNRSARNVNYRPIMHRADLAHIDQLVGDRQLVYIGSFAMLLQGEQAVPPYLDDAFGTGDETYDERFLGRKKLGRQSNGRNYRNIGSFDAPVGEIYAGGRFRRAADANQNDIGLFEIGGILAIVMSHGEVEGVYAPEIFGVEGMLPANLRARSRVEIGSKTGYHWIEYGDAGNA